MTENEKFIKWAKRSHSSNDLWCDGEGNSDLGECFVCKFLADPSLARRRRAVCSACRGKESEAQRIIREAAELLKDKPILAHIRKQAVQEAFAELNRRIRKHSLGGTVQRAIKQEVDAVFASFEWEGNEK